MVQKKGKHGISTGNTLRAINSKHFRRYRKEAYIVRRDTAVKSKSHADVLRDVFEGANIPCEDVLFTLNKHNRWLLPDLIKDYIISDGLGEESEILDQCPEGLELVTRSKLIRNNNCDSIYACIIKKSKRDQNVRETIIKVGNSGYIDADNVLKTPALFSRQFARLQFLREFYASEAYEPEINAPNNGSRLEEEGPKTDEDGKEDDTQIAPVRLEVLYPCELTSVVSLKPKLLGHNTRKTFKCRNDIRRPWTLEGYQFRRRPQKEKRENIYGVIKEGLEDFYDEQDIDYTDDELEEVWGTSYSPSDNKIRAERKIRIKEETETKTSIDGKPYNQAIKPDEKAAGKKVKEVRINSKEESQEKKEQEIDTNNLVQNDLSPTLSIEGPEIQDDFNLIGKSIKTIPVSILLKKDESDVNALQDHYGDDYLECHCIPRRFLISISKYINDLELNGIGSAYKLLSILNKKTFSWLIFAHDPVNKLNTASEEVYNVSLNAHFKDDIITNVKIEGLEESYVISITEIIGKTISYLKDLPRESLIFEGKTSDMKNNQVVNTCSLLADMKNWTICTYFPDNSYVVNEMINSKPVLAALLEEKSVAILSRNNRKGIQMCTICHATARNALALLSCCHYFCSRCWESHIKTKVIIGCYNIYCPDANCNETVDTGMIISFLNVKDVLTYARRRHNVDVEKNRLAKWCSNETCGRVLLVNKLNVKTAKCSCGETMCFVCAGKPHWPLPCAQYLDYIRILIETRDKNITPHDFVLKFDSKYCRICFKIVKRYDKCSCVESCSCEGNLCIRCSFLWHVNTLNFKPKLNKTPASSVLTSVSGLDQHGQRNIFSEGRRTKWYKLAMKHRLQQHPFRLAKLQASSKLLANRLSHYILREERKCHLVYLDFIANEATHLRESDRVAHYMTQIVNMYSEINNIIESCAFFLSKENDLNGRNESLHRRTMLLSTCAKTICDLIKDGAFLNPKVVIERLKETCLEIRRVMESIVKEF